MAYLILGLAMFFSIHIVPMAPALREQTRALLSVRVYLLVFSLVSALALILIVIGYGQVRWQAGLDPELWAPPIWLRHVTMLLILPAMVLLVAAYVPSRIRSAVQHPMLAGVALWAFAHLLVNGDLASVILFGSFFIWAVVDAISASRRKALGPLGDRAGGLPGDVGAVLGGLAIYLIMLFWGHRWLIGVPLLP
jgi:uncharacterized membrane protein